MISRRPATLIPGVFVRCLLEQQQRPDLFWDPRRPSGDIRLTWGWTFVQTSSTLSRGDQSGTFSGRDGTFGTQAAKETQGDQAPHHEWHDSRCGDVVDVDIPSSLAQPRAARRETQRVRDRIHATQQATLAQINAQK